MLRIFASTLRRSARTIYNNAHPERFALQSLTYAQSKFWKTEVHQNKPVHQGQEHAQTSQGQVNTAGSQDNRVVIVRGLPQNWAEKDISVYFDQDSSRIQKVNLIKNRVGGNTGKALITFNSADNAESFIGKWDRNTIQSGELNQIINAQFFNLQKKEEPVPEVKSDLKTVFVSNLAFNCTSDDLHNFASDFGEVVSVDAPMTANNKTKGFAFITFKEVAEAQKFLTLGQEKDLLGRRLRYIYCEIMSGWCFTVEFNCLSQELRLRVPENLVFPTLLSPSKLIIMKRIFNSE